VIRWSPRSQYEIMCGAKAAFDIKEFNFHQMHKPPVKAQQFIASGIPFAVNPESYSAEYFAAKGLQVPSPKEIDYWLSKSYWEQTQAAKADLCHRISLKTVGLHYKQIINKIMEDEC
jgi:hypothetical protein